MALAFLIIPIRIPQWSTIVNPNIFIVKREYFKQLMKSAAWAAKRTTSPQAADSLHFSHPEHGVVSIIKDKGQYHVKHNGGYAGLMGKKGIFDHPKAAVNHAKEYIKQLGSHGVTGNAMHDMPSNPIKKSESPKTFGTTEQMHPTGKNTAMGQIARKQSLQKLRALKKPNLGKSTAMERYLQSKGKSPHESRASRPPLKTAVGVHQPLKSSPGTSEAGAYAARKIVPANSHDFSPNRALGKQKAIAMHRQKLSELKGMKTPNLGKSEDIMKKSALEQAKELLKSLQANPNGLEDLAKAISHIKGVHMPVGPGAPGMSEIGKINSNQSGGKEFAASAAKHQIKKVLQASAQIKPKLGKEEIKEIPQEDKDDKEPSGTMGVKTPLKEIDPLTDKTGANPDYKAPTEAQLKEMVNKEEKTAEKGVHKPAFMHSKKSGTSDVGARMHEHAGKATKEYAKGEHKKVLAEAKAMPKPNLGKDQMNPDMKQDAALGETVEHAVESHMMANAGAEAKEGHPMAKAYFKSKLAKCGGMK